MTHTCTLASLLKELTRRYMSYQASLLDIEKQYICFPLNYYVFCYFRCVDASVGDIIYLLYISEVQSGEAGRQSLTCHTPM